MTQFLQTSQAWHRACCSTTSACRCTYLHCWHIACAEIHAAVSVQGTIFGHEQQVLQRIHQELGKQNVALRWSLRHTNPAILHLKFHRVQQRLPADEIEAFLGPTTGDLTVLYSQQSSHVATEQLPSTLLPISSACNVAYKVKDWHPTAASFICMHL